MNIIFAGGGTAGHITPSLAIGERVLERYPDSKIAFIGRFGGRENAAIEKAGYKLYTIEVEGLSGKELLSNIPRAYKLLRAVRECRNIITDFGADALLATGGYVSYPPLRAAIRIGIPAFIHESNATSGAVTRLMARKCTEVFLGYSDDVRVSRLPNALTVGNPTLGNFGKLKRSAARRSLGIAERDIFIVSVGGSLGAGVLNSAIVKVMKEFSVKERGVRHIHASGDRYFEEIEKSEPELTSGIGGCRIIPYINDMATYLTAADIAVTRAGAMTLAELSRTGTPAIVIPSPNVSEDHQTKNARVFERAGAVILVKEDENIEKNLGAAIKTLVASCARRDMMRAAYSELKRPHAADNIIDEIVRFTADENG